MCVPFVQAISNSSSEEHQSRAWTAVCPLVLQLKGFYEFSNQLETCIVELLKALSSSDMTPSQHLETQQALTKQFAEILHFSLSFDDLKVCVLTGLESSPPAIYKLQSIHMLSAY